MFTEKSKLVFNKRVSCITSILVGDELGQVKRIDIPRESTDSKDKRKASITSSSTDSSSSDCSRSSTATVRSINKEIINDTLSPEKPILSIRPFKSQTLASQEDSDDDDLDSNGKSSVDDASRMRSLVRKHETAAAANAETSVLFLITQKPDQVYVYNSVTESFTLIKFNRPEGLPPNVQLIGSAPIDRNNIALVYENGAIFTLNIERELYSTCMQVKTKAMKLLGINENTDFEEESNLLMSPRKKRKTHKSDTKVDKTNESIEMQVAAATGGDHGDGNVGDEAVLDEMTTRLPGSANTQHKKVDKTEFQPNPHFDPNPLRTIFLPPWRANEITVTAFEVNSERIAIAGKNLYLKVFDLRTGDCIFTAKRETKKGILSSARETVLISGITFLGPIKPRMSAQQCKPIVVTGKKMTATIDNSIDHNAKTCKVAAGEVPCLVATCCKSDPFIRIYDLRLHQRKPVWVIGLKDSTFNNDSNPPSFASITATRCPLASAVPIQQLIVGTTMGRMIALELKFNSHSHRQLGVFEGFSGGTIRGIAFVPNVKKIGHHSIVSCSLDRFVRVHEFITGANASRHIRDKFYIKTRPTCVVPIVGSFLIDHSQQMTRQQEAHEDDDDEDDEEHDEEEDEEEQEEEEEDDEEQDEQDEDEDEENESGDNI